MILKKLVLCLLLSSFFLFPAKSEAFSWNYGTISGVVY